MKWLDKLLLKMEKRHIRDNKGVLVFYMTFDPSLKNKNVLSYTINPEMKQDEAVESALIKAADEIRKYYRENPEKLDFILEVMEESGYSV